MNKLFLPGMVRQKNYPRKELETGPPLAEHSASNNRQKRSVATDLRFLHVHLNRQRKLHSPVLQHLEILMR